MDELDVKEVAELFIEMKKLIEDSCYSNDAADRSAAVLVSSMVLGRRPDNDLVAARLTLLEDSVHKLKKKD